MDKTVVYRNLGMWEILVPATKDGVEFSLEHHKLWDAEVKKYSKGLTILKSAKGEWIHPVTNELVIDVMIPVRIICTDDDLIHLVDFTIDHYNQEAVMAYEISKIVIVRQRK